MWHTDILSELENANRYAVHCVAERLQSAGIDLPTVEIEYNHLTYEADATVGSAGMPTLTNTVKKALLVNSDHSLCAQLLRLLQAALAASPSNRCTGGDPGPKQFNNMRLLFLQSIVGKGKQGSTPVKILDDVSGVLKPGRLTLLMGPPGSGKSVFLKVSQCYWLSQDVSLYLSSKTADRVRRQDDAKHLHVCQSCATK